VVVGAGLLGLAAARALTRRGADVIVLEQAQVGHEAGGSKGSCRIFRVGYPDAEYVALARRAREPWTELEDSGSSSADAAVAALAGAVPDIRAGTAVSSIADDGREVTAATAQGTVTARAAVVCAGPWTSGLLSPAGISVPSAATLEQVGYVAPAAAPGADLPIFIRYGDDETYGLPVPGSPLYKIGLHHSGPPADPSRQDQDPDPGLSARLTGLARRYLPGFRPELVRSERCVYDNSPDEDFIVDRAGQIVIGCGTSGHGFKFGPLLGEWLASLAAGLDPGPAARRFRRDRFSPGLS
jgi:sarcosine oxidase